MEENNTTQTTPDPQPQKEEKHLGCLLAFIGLIVIAIIGNSLGWFEQNGSESIDSNIKNGAYQTAKIAVKNELARPSTADFSLWSADFQQFSERVYRVSGTVSAKNGLGQKQEFNYKVTMTFYGGNPEDRTNWEVTGCNVTPK